MSDGPARFEPHVARGIAGARAWAATAPTAPPAALPIVISYSGGSASEEMVHLVVRGEIPRPEHIAVAFADTGDEHEWTYEAVERVAATCARAGIPFLRSSAGEALSAHLATIGRQDREHQRADHPPFWIAKGDGRGKAIQKCTRAFKVAPMRRSVSEWLAAERLPKRVIKWVGFSRDEVQRAHKAIGRQDVAWERLDFPLIRLGMVRAQVRADLAAHGVAPPRFSMCVFCPYKSDERWRAMTLTDAAKAIAVDESVRDLDEIGLTDGEAYCSDELVPVEAVLKRGAPRQIPLPGLESYCDGGACFL